MLNNITIKYLALICIIAVAPVFASDEIEIRKITPPNLSAAHLGKKIICYRPKRRKEPNMQVEMIGDKVIAHNYGHGGGGWTLAPGITTYVNNQLINSPYATDLKKDTPMTIIGGGVIGLFTAYDLVQKGYINLTIVADKFTDLTSHNAGGLISPGGSMDNTPEVKKILDQIGIDAYKFYAGIAKKQNADFKRGAKIVPVYCYKLEDSDLEDYVGKVMQPAKKVIMDFGNGTTRKMFVYDDGIFVSTGDMMLDLNAYLKKHHVNFKTQKINNFSEIKSKYIINCTGLAAAQLNNDPDLIPTQGHMIMLKDQKPEDLQYMVDIYLGAFKNARGQELKRSFYIFPKHLPGTKAADVGVIGGTFIYGATDATTNQEELAMVLQNAKDFYGIINR